MQTLLNRLEQEHHQLQEMAEEIGRIFAGDVAAMAQVAPDRQRLVAALRDMMELLQSHEQQEKLALFPILQRMLPKDDHWQIKMMEIQSEAIISEATHLHDWAMGSAPALSTARLRETMARLLRWLREHVVMEEERFFSKLRS